MLKAALFFTNIMILSMSSPAFANDASPANEGSKFILAVVVALFSALIGYSLGILKAFREHKLKAYQEMLQPILTMAYKSERGNSEETNFNQALTKLWLYANKDVAKKADIAVSIIHNPSRGNITEALQETIAAMRRDIQIFPWQKLDSSEVNHLYTQLSGKKMNNGI